MATEALGVSPFAAVILRGNVGPVPVDPIALLTEGGALAGEIQVGGVGVEDLVASAAVDGSPLIPAARVLTQLACELLGVFYFLEIEGVALAPVPLPRAERRRAAREARPIAHTALIQPGIAASDSAPTSRSDPGDDGRYSHRFFVRGHYKHHRAQTSRIARARPDLVRPCPKPGCGECRRIPIAGHWKGPEGAPLRHQDTAASPARSRRRGVTLAARAPRRPGTRAEPHTTTCPQASRLARRRLSSQTDAPARVFQAQPGGTHVHRPRREGHPVARRRALRVAL